MIDVDMSVFVGQDFDCEMLDRFGQWDNIHKLVKVSQPINNGCINYYGGGDGVHWYGCRPRLNHWHFNDGNMVLPDGLVVEFMTCYATGAYNGAETFNRRSIEKGVVTNGKILTELDPRFPYTLNAVGMPQHKQDIIAVKILGTAKGYRCQGLEVIEESDS